jgi:hypothetical protein
MHTTACCRSGTRTPVLADMAHSIAAGGRRAEADVDVRSAELLCSVAALEKAAPPVRTGVTIAQIERILITWNLRESTSRVDCVLRIAQHANGIFRLYKNMGLFSAKSAGNRLCQTKRRFAAVLPRVRLSANVTSAQPSLSLTTFWQSRNCYSCHPGVLDLHAR